MSQHSSTRRSPLTATPREAHGAAGELVCERMPLRVGSSLLQITCSCSDLGSDVIFQVLLFCRRASEGRWGQVTGVFRGGHRTAAVDGGQVVCRSCEVEPRVCTSSERRLWSEPSASLWARVRRTYMLQRSTEALPLSPEPAPPLEQVCQTRV